MAKRFIIAKPNGEYNREHLYNIGPLGDVIAGKVKSRPVDNWRLGLKPKEQGVAEISWRPGSLSKTQAVSQLIGLCGRKGDLGDLYGIERLVSGYQVRVRVVDLPHKTPLTLTDCNARVRRCHRAIARAKLGVVSGGRFACRVIAGTSFKSQHAATRKGKPCANAEDWFGSAKELKALDRFILGDNGRNARLLDVQNYIADGKIYTRENNYNPVAYTGSCAHKTHRHIDHFPVANQFCS